MKNTLKKVLLLSTILFLGLNCEKEKAIQEQEPIAQENTPTVYQERLSAKEIPSLTNMVSEKIGGEKVGLNLKTNNLDGLGEYKVNWDEINLITDTLGIKTYALRLETKNPEPLVFYNIVVTEDTEGNFIDPIIAEYVVDKDFYLQWREDPDKLKDFRGEAYYYDMDGSNFSKKGKTATLSARSPGQAPCPSITFGPSGPRAPYIPNIYCWTYVSYGLCETQINYDTGTSYHNASNCGAGTGSPIYGYSVSCGSSPSPDRNTSKSGVTSKSPCGGGGGGSRPGAVPINPVNPGMADIGSFVGFLDNKLQLTTAQENFLENKPEVELILELQLFLKKENYSSDSRSMAKQIVDAVMKKSLISKFPFIKYPDNKAAEYKRKYPKLTEYLKNQLPKVADIKKITDAIHKFTKIPLEQIKKDLKWDDGPILEIVQLDNYKQGETDEDTAGYFDRSKPDRVLIDIDYVNLIEKRTSNQAKEDALLFWIGTTILHEYVHYGDYSNGFDYLGEEGRKFEIEVYGANVQPDIARLILNRLK